MKFYDEFDLLDHFNKVCGGIADYVVDRAQFSQDLDARATRITIPCDMQFHDVDEWWGVDFNGDNFMTLYLRALTKLKERSPEEYKDHFVSGQEILGTCPNLKHHLQAKIEKSSIPEPDMLRYIPHKVAYAYNAFMELDGFQKLQQTVQLLDNVRMDIVLMPKQDAMDIHAPHTYDLVIVLEAGDGKPLVSKFTPSTPKQQLH